jgi:hypothetical protein
LGSRHPLEQGKISGKVYLKLRPVGWTLRREDSGKDRAQGRAPKGAGPCGFLGAIKKGKASACAAAFGIRRKQDPQARSKKIPAAVQRGKWPGFF